MEKLVIKNPATGELIREIEKTPVANLPEIFASARKAQTTWALLSTKTRARHLLNLREVILDRVDELAEFISKENGKPPFEAMTNDLLPSVELLTYFSKKGPSFLKDHRVRLGNPFLLLKTSSLNYWPLGVVAVISPWNFPFFLPFGEIAMALLTGNGIIFKPSEATPLTGLKIQELCDAAGIPPGLIQTVIGEGGSRCSNN